jgi:predicted site-specific integrase-resolvase
MPTARLLTAKDAVAKLNVPMETVYKLGARGVLRPIRLVARGRLRFTEADLARARRPPLTIRETAAELGVSSASVCRLIEAGELTPIRTTPRAMIYLAPEDIDALIER